MGYSDEFLFRDCDWCGLRHAQMIRQAHNVVAQKSDGSKRWYVVMSCPDCGGITVVEHNSPQQSTPAEFSAYPDAGVETTAIKDLPDDVGGYYAGAIKVLRAGVPDAAAVQLRRALEAAAAHYDIEEKTLVKSIEKLIDEGHVTKSFGEVLHHVRKIGNQGAHHTDEPVDDEAAQRALRFTAALLRNLFEVPAELAAIKEGDEAG